MARQSYTYTKFCLAIIFPFYNMSSSNFVGILILACFQLFYWVKSSVHVVKCEKDWSLLFPF